MIFYSIGIFLLLFGLLRFVPTFQIDNGNKVWVMPIAFVAKVIAGYIFVYLYSHYYGSGELSADAGAFITESKMVQEVFYTSPSAYFKFLFGFHDDAMIHEFIPNTTHWDVTNFTIINDSINVQRVHSLIHFISFNQIDIHILIVCFISAFGIKNLFQTFKHYTNLNQWIFIALLTLLPSVLFWASGILKEPFLFLGISLFLRGLFGKLSIQKSLLYLFFGCILILAFKAYVMIAFAAATIPYLIYKYSKIHWGIISIASLLIGLSTISIIPKISDTLVAGLTKKQFDFNNVARGGLHVYADSIIYIFNEEHYSSLDWQLDSVRLNKEIDAQFVLPGKPIAPQSIHITPNNKYWFKLYFGERCGSYFEQPLINNSKTQLIKNIPGAIVNTLLRPVPSRANNWLYFIVLCEQYLLYGFLIYSIFRHRKLNKQDKELILYLTTFTLPLILLIGWTTPVVGAIVRYRYPILLVFFLIGCILYRPKSLQT